MASRSETLLFLVDVQVHNAQALAALRGFAMDALDARTQRYGALSQAAREATVNHRDLTDQIERMNAVTAQPPGSSGGTGVVAGSRSDRFAGSRTNPVVVAQESGQAAGLGSLAADSANAPGAAQSAKRNMGGQPLIDSVAVEQAVRKGTQAGTAPQDNMILSALQGAENMRRNVGAPSVWDNPALSYNRGGGAGVGPSIWDQAAIDALNAPKAPSGRAYSAAEAAQQLGVSTAAARDLAARGQLAGARMEQGRWVIPVEAVEGAAAGGSGRGGSGGVPPISFGSGGSGGGGSGFGGGSFGFGNGRSRTQFLPWRGVVTGPDSGSSPFSFANLFKGDGGNGGAFGLPGFGSIGSSGGLGLEHWLLTGLGLTASAGSAIGGAGLLGAAGLSQMAIGGGSNMLVNHLAISGAAGIVQNYQALQQAIAEYGKGSKQAVAAQNLLNYSMKQGGPAVTQLAQNYLALDKNFRASAKNAEQQSALVMNQVIGLGQHYVPAVTQAAQRNLSIVNTGLKPLFSWLEGPEGMGIFNTLENKFAQDLPTSIHALDMGLEDFLRLMQVASQYTGGLSKDLDRIFTDKSKESTAQYRAEVEKLVGDLKEWEGLLKVLGQDLSGLFHADAGTANSIVGALTDMLKKLHAWEQSTTGQTDLMNIFAVHKQQILTLLDLLQHLASGYGSFYMDVAPPLVKALTDIAGAFDDIAKAIESIPGGGALLGLTLVMAKLGVLMPSLKLLTGGSLLSGVARGGGGAVATGAEAVAGGVAASKIGGLAGLLGGNAVKSGVENVALKGSLAAEGLGAGGLAEMLAGGGAALAPLIGTVVPLAVAGIAAYGGYKLLTTVFNGGGTPTTSYSTSGLAKLLQSGPDVLGKSSQPNATAQADQRLKALGYNTNTVGKSSSESAALQHLASSQGTSGSFTVAQLAPTKQAQTLLVQFLNTMRDSTTVAKASTDQLQRWVNEGTNLAQIFPKDADSIDKFTDRAKQDLGSLQGAMKLMTDRWNKDANSGLGTLEAVFAANLKVIANQLGLTSSEGEQALHTNVQKMVKDLTNGMADGKISVAAGMPEITKVLDTGMKDGADNWKTYVTDMLDSLSTLRSRGKISAAQYTQDVNGTLIQGAQAVHANVLAQYAQMEQDVQQKFQQGDDGLVVTQQGLNKQLEALHGKALSAAASAEVIWLSNLELSLQAAGKATTAEMNAIEAAISAADAKASSTAVAYGNASHHIAGAPAGHATGGMVTTPTYMVGEEAPAHPEYVLATNPAYRRRNLDLWMQAGRALGVRGHATGGVESYSQLEQLWTSAGGPSSAAPLMAAIAEAESHGQINAYNQSGASGLWQILGQPFPGNVFDPLTNARMAVAKYAGGNGLGAWATYTSGAYKQFLQPNVTPAHAAATAAHGGASGVTVVQLPEDFAHQTHVGLPSWLPKPGESLNQQIHTLNEGLGSKFNSSVETLIGKVLTKVLAGLTTAFQNEQTKAGNQSTIMSALQGLNHGTKTGLSGAALKATGLSHKQVTELLGGGPASYGVLSTIDKQQAADYKSQATKLEAAYKEAVKSHNKKLQDSLLNQLQAVDGAMESSISASQQAIIQKIQAQGAAYDQKAQNFGTGSSILSTIQNLAPGTSLSNLGITPAIASALGLPSNYASLEGTGNSYLQNLLSTTGSLTPAQIAAATTGNNAANSSIQTEIGGYDNELTYDESQLPNLSGTAKSQMMTTILGLISTISGLDSTIQDNNTNLTALTTATNSNTSAVSNNTYQQSGTVSYQYNGQQYLASDTVASLRVGS